MLIYRELLTKQQWNLLKAIAREGTVYAPTSKDFISKHALESPATAFQSLNANEEWYYGTHADSKDNSGVQALLLAGENKNAEEEINR